MAIRSVHTHARITTLAARHHATPEGSTFGLTPPALVDTSATRRLPDRSGTAKIQICISAGLIHMNPASAPNGGFLRAAYRLRRHRP